MAGNNAQGGKPEATGLHLTNTKRSLTLGIIETLQENADEPLIRLGKVEPKTRAAKTTFELPPALQTITTNQIPNERLVKIWMIYDSGMDSEGEYKKHYILALMKRIRRKPRMNPSGS